jgi:hypothetical protein
LLVRQLVVGVNVPLQISERLFQLRGQSFETRLAVQIVELVRIVEQLPPIGIGSPAASRNVGAKSTFSAMASLCVPDSMPAGQRTRNGIRIDSSYMNRLSKNV